MEVRSKVLHGLFGQTDLWLDIVFLFHEIPKTLAAQESLGFVQYRLQKFQTLCFLTINGNVNLRLIEFQIYVSCGKVGLLAASSINSGIFCSSSETLCLNDILNRQTASSVYGDGRLLLHDVLQDGLVHLVNFSAISSWLSFLSLGSFNESLIKHYLLKKNQIQEVTTRLTFSRE
jgi:hypothetical protein